MSLFSVPEDIITEIVGFLSKDAKLQLRTTCKSLYNQTSKDLRVMVPIGNTNFDGKSISQLHYVDRLKLVSNHYSKRKHLFFTINLFSWNGNWY